MAQDDELHNVGLSITTYKNVVTTNLQDIYYIFTTHLVD